MDVLDNKVFSDDFLTRFIHVEIKSTNQKINFHADI